MSKAYIQYFKNGEKIHTTGGNKRDIRKEFDTLKTDLELKISTHNKGLLNKMMTNCNSINPNDLLEIRMFIKNGKYESGTMRDKFIWSKDKNKVNYLQKTFKKDIKEKVIKLIESNKSGYNNNIEIELLKELKIYFSCFNVNRIDLGRINILSTSIPTNISYIYDGVTITPEVTVKKYDIKR